MKYHDIFATIRLFIIVAAVVLAAIMCREETHTGEPDPAPAQTTEAPSPPPAATLTPAVEAQDPRSITIEVEPEPEPRYHITDAERTVIEQVVMAEAGGEDYDGQRAVAQCILNAAELEGIRPTEAVVKYKYTPTRKNPTEGVVRAVSAVFDAGDFPIDDTPLWFYAPARCAGKWHETQRFVAEIGGHKFFAAWP